ncbi:MAG: hypothetical protein IKU86_00275 [Thermoguttaceae bacterium]|nr:hypothetical protein [Thermoguttaceae bacterium]
MKDVLNFEDNKRYSNYRDALSRALALHEAVDILYEDRNFYANHVLQETADKAIGDLANEYAEEIASALLPDVPADKIPSGTIKILAAALVAFDRKTLKI